MEHQHKEGKKIGVLIDQLIPGGVQKVAIEEVRNLRKLGYNASLLILMRRGFESQNRYLINNIPYLFLSDRCPFFLQKSFKLPIFRFLTTFHLLSPLIIPFIVKTGEFDILISHGTTVTLSAYSIAKFRKIPYITVIHDPAVFILENIYAKTALKILFPIIKPLARFFEKGFLKSAKACLVDSKVHASYLKHYYEITPQVLHLAIDPPAKIPQKRGPKIITFGRWDAGKNLSLLLRLAKKLPTSQIVIAGTWSNQNELSDFQKLIIKKKLNSQVELMTGYQKKSLAKICAQGRFWIHPHFEAFSLSALEAASYGLPIIIPKNSGVTELFVEGKHGFFPEPFSLQKIKELASLLLADEELARKMGTDAAGLVKKLYTHRVRARHLSNLINKTLAQKLIVLETAHVGHSGIAGGDLIFEEMAKRANLPYETDVIIHELSKEHWRKSQVANLIMLPKSIFDISTNPISILLTYLARTARTSLILRKILTIPSLIYSSNDVFPDVVPAYLAKITKRHILWIARVHHLWLRPGQRPGRLLINLGSAVLQQISLALIKSKADLILVLNENLKIQLESKGFNPQKIIILGGGVDYQAIRNSKVEGKTRYDAVFLGRIHPVKGVLDLPLIWRQVTAQIPKATLAVIGAGSREILNDLKKRIKSQKLEKNITLLGFLPKKKVISTLKSSSVFLFTDHEAGFGLATLEAMAAGLPVVGYDIGILGNVFKKGFIKVADFDQNAFATAVVKILTDPRLQKSLSQASQKEAKSFDWQITSRKFANILDTMSS